MGAIVWCGISRVVFGASIAELATKIGQIMITDAEIAAKTPFADIALTGGVLAEDVDETVQVALGGYRQWMKPTIDRAAMGRLAKALVFVCGADHPTTVALQAAAESGSERDIKNARALFLRLKQGERRAALAMLGD